MVSFFQDRSGTPWEGRRRRFFGRNPTTPHSGRSFSKMTDGPFLSRPTAICCGDLCLRYTAPLRTRTHLKFLSYKYLGISMLMSMLFHFKFDKAPPPPLAVLLTTSSDRQARRPTTVFIYLTILQ